MKPDFAKPVMLEAVYFVTSVRVQDNRGSTIALDYLTNRAGEWHIEMIPGRIVRIWNLRRYRDGHACDVYTIGPENLASWHVQGDTVQKPMLQPETA
jgi:hypothetical protein